MIVPCTAAVSLKINFARLQGGVRPNPLEPPLATGLNTVLNLRAQCLFTWKVQSSQPSIYESTELSVA